MKSAEAVKIRFIQTTIDKLCQAQTVEELDKAYNDAKDGWKTATGEDRGGFARLHLRLIHIAIIDMVYTKMRAMLLNNK